MTPRHHTPPPPTPSANHTGVVPRWRAWASTAAALIIGVIAGRYGLDAAATVLSLGALAAVLAWGLLLEARDRRRTNDFAHIDARHQVARALEGDR